MPPSAQPLDRLDDFVAAFRDDFRRRDQLRWAGIYLQGLLAPIERKTIGAMARHVVLPPYLIVEDVAQALQNFVNQSPWDEGKVWRRHRRLLADRFAHEPGAFVVEDLAIRKQGRHSVGVQRQYSATHDCKANCQVAVALYWLGRTAACPLSLRLYLPKAWLTNEPRLLAAGVPLEDRRPHAKTHIALDLLDEARSEGWPEASVLVGPGYGGDPDFEKALQARGLELARAPDSQLLHDLRTALLDDLGLSHFEGRSWRGFHHHACLVMLAHALRHP
jgi:SRSO17 transposase